MSTDHDPDQDDGDGLEEWTAIARRRGEFFALTGVLADFILDYQRYDPAIRTDPYRVHFRGGLLTATSENAAEFLHALGARRLPADELRSILGSSTPDLLAFIDFDTRRYVHSYYDLPLEDYVPTGWRGRLGDPREELRAVTPAS